MTRNLSNDISKLEMLSNKHILVENNVVSLIDEENISKDADNDTYLIDKLNHFVNFLNEDYSNRKNDDLNEVFEYL